MKQVFISYGKHGNEQLLLLYGFVMNDNSEEIFTFEDPLQWLDASVIPCKPQKDEFLENSGFLHGYSLPPPQRTSSC